MEKSDHFEKNHVKMAKNFENLKKLRGTLEKGPNMPQKKLIFFWRSSEIKNLFLRHGVRKTQKI